MTSTHGKKRRFIEDSDAEPDEASSSTTSSSAAPTCTTSATVTTQPDTSLGRRDRLWFDDGGVVLLAGNTGFRVSTDTSSLTFELLSY